MRAINICERQVLKVSSIAVSIDDLMDKINSIQEDEHEAVVINVIEDDYTKELEILAVSNETDEPISYGTLEEFREDIY